MIAELFSGVTVNFLIVSECGRTAPPREERFYDLIVHVSGLTNGGGR
jgi:hypothetical protein